MTSPRPIEYTWGLNELIRAHRYYTGLSARTFAERCGIKERSLSDMEVGRRGCPMGFLDTVEKVIEDFDAEVDTAVEQAEHMLEGDDGVINIDISRAGADEWQRAVIGRAAVTSGLILPTIVGEHEPDREAG